MGYQRQPALNDHTVGGAAQKSTPRKKPVDSRSKKTSKDRPRPSLQQHLALIEFLAELDDEPRLTEFDDFCKTVSASLRTTGVSAHFELLQEPNRALRFIDWFELYRNNKDELLAMASNLRGLVKRPA